MSPGKKPRVKRPRPPPTPPTVHPWDIPASPKVGDTGEDITYAAVGRALSQWEKFESNLSQIFAVIIGSHPTAILTAVRAYGTIQTFRGRSDMVQGAAEVFFLIHKNDDLEKRVNDFLKVARNYAARRNEIAHGIVGTVPWDAAGKQGSALFPARYASGKNKVGIYPIGVLGQMAPGYIYSSIEIETFTARFSELTDEAKRIWLDVGHFHRSRAGQAKPPPYP